MDLAAGRFPIDLLIQHSGNRNFAEVRCKALTNIKKKQQIKGSGIMAKVARGMVEKAAIYFWEGRQNGKIQNR